MFLPRLLGSIDSFMLEKYTDELLNINQKTKEYGLELTRDEIKEMMTVRERVLQSYGRVELGVEVFKELSEVFCTSPYIENENFALTLNELLEVFHYLKNETDDMIGDSLLISIIKNYYDGTCKGSMEFLKSKLEEFAEQFRRDVNFRIHLLERDEH
ncbi:MULTISPECIES: DUF6323 family protein [Virgibacillus]|uniref:Uncharacterized protein n=3 Tax=Virgibacillus TaxID=84406 RepID=A0A024QI01_9BACI|nr:MULTISPECIES: DUF6323 family protein [Virgibacillus]EQB34733.1 hypothetical protein M948_20305 [Virgibacillus sp. CM-4]GGJ76232.1 hypothetical protein GCM10007111_42260 [Virgibacillus kapii]CDQ41566.1 hypothetical protein BN990_03939 [Virgibacillus massiliensis]